MSDSQINDPRLLEGVDPILVRVGLSLDPLSGLLIPISETSPQEKEGKKEEQGKQGEQETIKQKGEAEEKAEVDAKGEPKDGTSKEKKAKADLPKQKAPQFWPEPLPIRFFSGPTNIPLIKKFHIICAYVEFALKIKLDNFLIRTISAVLLASVNFPNAQIPRLNF